MGERRSQADQTEHRYTFRSCPPGWLPASKTLRVNAEETVEGGHGWLPPYLCFFLSPIVFELLLYAEGGKVDTVFVSLDWNYVLYMSKAVRLCSFGIFLKSERAWKKASHPGEKGSYITQYYCNRGTVCALFIGRLKPLCLLTKQEDVTNNPRSIECIWMTRKKFI